MELIRLAEQPELTPWPTHSWPEALPPAWVDADRLHDLTHGVIGRQPAELGETLALLVVHDGAIVAEAYGPDVTAATTLISWSMAKSMLHAAMGLLMIDGAIDPSAPVGRDEWADDARGAITLQQLLAMRSGLAWAEDYVDDQASDVIEMLFGSGRSDMAALVAAQELVAEPGSQFLYSSGTSNIVSAVLNTVLGGRSEVEDFLTRRLFGRLGMTTAVPKFDEVGTWVASSFVFASARDFARFGLLYARDGLWDGDRILPEGWVDRARRTISLDQDRVVGYGEHWWTARDELGTFCASGFEGQRIQIVPANDLVIVRLGKTPTDLGEAWKYHLDDIGRLFSP